MLEIPGDVHVGDVPGADDPETHAIEGSTHLILLLPRFRIREGTGGWAKREAPVRGFTQTKTQAGSA
jgi:hypothetical protein